MSFELEQSGKGKSGDYTDAQLYWIRLWNTEKHNYKYFNFYL